MAAEWLPRSPRSSLGPSLCSRHARTGLRVRARSSGTAKIDKEISTAMASQWPKDINRHPTTIRIKRLKDLLTHVILTSCVWRDLLGFNRWTLTQPDIGTKGALVKAVVFCYLENAAKRRRIRLCGCSTLLDTGFGSHTWGTKTEATVCVPLAKCVSWFVKQWVSPNEALSKFLAGLLVLKV